MPSSWVSNSPQRTFPAFRGQSIEPEEYVKYLDQVSVLDSLLAEEKKQVANALVEHLSPEASFSVSV